MRSVAETSVGNRAGGEAFARRSEAAADKCGSPTARAQAAYALGVSCDNAESERSLQLLDRCVQYAESVENRWIRAFALTESLWIRAKSGRPLESLRGYHDVVDTWFRGGDWANQWLSLRHVFAIFESLGHDEVATILHGALDGAGVMQALPLEPGTADDFNRAVERLCSRLEGTASPTPPRKAAPCATKRSSASPSPPSPTRPPPPKTPNWRELAAICAAYSRQFESRGGSGQASGTRARSAGSPWPSS